jgi:hypothetical protein
MKKVRDSQGGPIIVTTNKSVRNDNSQLVCRGVRAKLNTGCHGDQKQRTPTIMKTRSKLTFALGFLLFLLSYRPGAAYYDPGLQRWLNRDPIADFASPINILKPAFVALFYQRDLGGKLYQFVHNLPTSGLDPDGRLPIEDMSFPAGYFPAPTCRTPKPPPAPPCTIRWSCWGPLASPGAYPWSKTICTYTCVFASDTPSGCANLTAGTTMSSQTVEVTGICPPTPIITRKN